MKTYEFTHLLQSWAKDFHNFNHELDKVKPMEATPEQWMESFMNFVLYKKFLEPAKEVKQFEGEF